MLAVVFLIALGIVGLLLILASLSPNEVGIRTTGDARLDRYIRSLAAAVDNLYRFVAEVGQDEYASYILDNVEGLDWMKDLENIRIPNRMLSMIVMKDLIKCHRKLGHGLGLTGTKEGLGLAIAVTRFVKCGKTGAEVAPLDWLNKGFIEANMPIMTDVVKGLDASRIEGHDDELLFSVIFGRDVANPDFARRYAVLVYRWAVLVANADGKVSKRESEWLAELVRFGGRKSDTVGTAVPHENPLKELESLVGLAPVKTQIANLANLVKIQREREKRGMKVAPMSYHCVFTGNPGTGKTTVARIVAGIYRDLGVLKKGHLVETDRSGLVAEYVGQTAVKTNKIIDSALDGVLFVDEAYTLANSSQNDYGAEAIATLLKRMEDERGRLVVVLAGYTDEMAAFISSNPGLRSRFTRYVEFPNYSADELEAIFENAVKKNQYALTDGARQKLRERLKIAVAEGKRDFGNGRFARNLFEQTIERQATRLTGCEDLSAEVLEQLTTADIP